MSPEAFQQVKRVDREVESWKCWCCTITRPRRLVYSSLRLYEQHRKAEQLRELTARFTITADKQRRHVHKGLTLRHKPYYALYSYKVYKSERFDLAGNSLAILSGLASPSRSTALVPWIEGECEALRERGELALDLPPTLFPYIRPHDPNWKHGYGKYHTPCSSAGQQMFRGACDVPDSTNFRRHFPC